MRFGNHEGAEDPGGGNRRDMKTLYQLIATGYYGAGDLMSGNRFKYSSEKAFEDREKAKEYIECFRLDCAKDSKCNPFEVWIEIIELTLV